MRLSKIALAALVLIPQFCRGQSQGGALEAASNGQRQAYETLSASLHAVYTTVTTADGKAKPTRRQIEWWQEGGLCRWKEVTTVVYVPPQLLGKKPDPNLKPTDVEITIDGAVADGQCTSLVTPKRADAPLRQEAIIGVPTGNDSQFADVWTRANFVVQSNPRLTLLEVLQSSQWEKSARAVDEGGDRLIHVVCKNGPQLLPGVEAWLSAAHGYLAKRLILWYDGSFDPRHVHTEFEAEAFQELGPGSGIFFPKRTVMKMYGKGAKGRKPATQTETDFATVEVNQSFGPETFRVNLPAGILVANRLTNTIYTLGENGKPAPGFPVTRINDRVRPMLVPNASPTSRRWLYWLFFACPFLVVGLIYLAWKRARSRGPGHAT